MIILVMKCKHSRMGLPPPTWHLHKPCMLNVQPPSDFQLGVELRAVNILIILICSSLSDPIKDLAVSCRLNFEA